MKTVNNWDDGRDTDRAQGVEDFILGSILRSLLPTNEPRSPCASPPLSASGAVLMLKMRWRWRRRGCTQNLEQGSPQQTHRCLAPDQATWRASPSISPHASPPSNIAPQLPRRHQTQRETQGPGVVEERSTFCWASNTRRCCSKSFWVFRSKSSGSIGSEPILALWHVKMG